MLHMLIGRDTGVASQLGGVVLVHMRGGVHSLELVVSDAALAMRLVSKEVTPSSPLAEFFVL